MSTAERRALHLASILVLLVWSNWNGNLTPVRVLATPAIVVLGDSTVDVGVNSHIDTFIRSDWPPYGRDFPGHKATGRFSDGMVSPDFVAERFGYPPPYSLAFNDPSAKGEILLNGINTASSGSGFLDFTLSGFCISLSTQIEWTKQWMGNVTELVGATAAQSIIEEAIYVISTGSNDWINSYYTNPLLQAKYNREQYHSLITGTISARLQDLYNIGARRIALVGLPPIGCVPFQMQLYNSGGKCIEEFNNDAMTANAATESLLQTLQPTLPGSALMYLDSYTQLYNAVINPTQFGIMTISTAESCCDIVGNVSGFGPLCNPASPVCANANEYLWWDGFHPTQIFYRTLGYLFFDVVTSSLGIPT
jgi:phospholipase/lecithinase/hemolysin